MILSISVYGHIDPALSTKTFQPEAMIFTFLVRTFMDMMTMHLSGFFPILFWGREDDVLRFNTFSLMGPGLGPEPLTQGYNFTV